MQNWDNLQNTATFGEHNNNWYNNMFAANIKTEPGTPQQRAHSPATSSGSASTQLENFLKQHQQPQQFTAMDTHMTVLSPSPTASEQQQQQQQHFYDTANMHQQLLQQQHYQQHFQQGQQAAAQNQVTSHLSLGFNPLTPPGLPQAILPAMTHFYNQTTTTTTHEQNQRNQQQTSIPQNHLENPVKSALTPRYTPPMEAARGKSPKPPNPPVPANPTIPVNEPQQDLESMSNSSGEPKSIVESDDDETIHLPDDEETVRIPNDDDETIHKPVYNSHGKMKNYKCKHCDKVTITKLAFWEHARLHMKADKMLQCSRCPFVTELKHHLEYHIRKHKNLKPFQCDKCNYTCVNKSMLNSHRKSHSSVYQYRCIDCDYATKYCHSFKLHLRKYGHNPAVVLDEDGIPNPSVVIDIYGTRRGPKNKSCSGPGQKKHKTSQLSAALQGLPPPQKPVSPAKSTCSTTSDLPILTHNLSLQQQQQEQQQQKQQQQNNNNNQIPAAQQAAQPPLQNGNLSDHLAPLASLLQQNPNMAFFPYWNLNLQMLAAQQQAAVLAQLSPTVREQLQKQANEQNKEPEDPQEMDKSEGEGEDEDADTEVEDNQDFDHKSLDSAMDLSQGIPAKEEQLQQKTPSLALNLKVAADNNETPLYSSNSSNRRKGRVLKLDHHEELQNNSFNSKPNSPQPNAQTEVTTKNYEPSSADEGMEIDNNHINHNNNNNNNNPTNNSNTSTASSSGNSSNSSTNASNSNNSTANSSPANTPTLHECKYCDIIFKNAVIHSIHMGYHSCDDVFKCNMCGEKCDGAIGLFVHMARNAHS